MKKFTDRFLTKFNIFLGSLIALTGVVGCRHQKTKVVQDNDEPKIADTTKVDLKRNNDPIVCKYGVPQARYSIRGSVINESKLTKRELTVLICGEPHQKHIIRKVVTDENGTFTISYAGFPISKLFISVEGFPESEKEVTVDLDDRVDKWNLGEGAVDVTLVIPAEDADVPIPLKYGVPPSRFDSDK